MIIIDNAGEKQDINVQKEISKAIRRREKKYITQIEEAKELLKQLIKYGIKRIFVLKIK